MDIWRWVDDMKAELHDAGNERLAQVMHDVPNATVGARAAEAAALIPEGLALAASVDHPWIEVFLRHWDLQRRGGGLASLPDAVALFERSHRPDAIDCPQSVCTVQDLAIAYAGADGPGFATERLEISAETLQRIDPSWACFMCISGEHADALIDDGRPTDALAFVATQRAAARAAGREASVARLADGEADALIALGRPAEAVEVLDRCAVEATDDGEVFRLYRTMVRATALTATGDLAGAAEALPGFDEVVGEPGKQAHWATALEPLAGRGGPPNDWELGVDLDTLLRRQRAEGRVRDAITIALVQARLALERHAGATARRALAAADAERPRLAADCDAEEAIASVAARAAAAPEEPVVLPDDAETLLASLAAEDDDAESPGRDPEQDLRLLVAARTRWPAERELLDAHLAALRALRLADEGQAELEAWLAAHPEDHEMRLSQGFELLEAGRPAEIDAVAADLEARGQTVDATWLRANAAWEAEDAEGALHHATAVAEADPEALNARRLAAHAALDLKRWTEARTWAEKVLADDPDAAGGDDEWALVTAATALGDWATVRASAERLEIELEGNSGPVDEAWGWTRLRFGTSPQSPQWIGLRTGPVTAQVEQIAPPWEPQHAGDVVLLDSIPLHVPDDDAEGSAGWLTFSVRDVLEPAGMRAYELDGLHPGEDRWSDLVDGLREEGWYVDQQSSEEYVLEVDGEERPALYAFLAVPAQTSDAEAHAALERLVGDPEAAGLVWTALVRAAGDTEAAEAHQARSDRLGIVS